MLRVRLSVLVAGALFAALAASAFLSVALFEGHQVREMSSLLDRELERVKTLLDNPAVGASLLDAGFHNLSLQLIAADGGVVVPTDTLEPIPVGEGWQTWGSKRVLVAAAPWTTLSGVQLGSIRLAYDGAEALATRAALWRNLMAASALIAVVGAVVSLILLRRQLEPLSRLAREAATLEPSNPQLSLPPMRDDEVGRVAASLEKAVAAIRQRQHDERAALAGVAHELAAPLTVVTGQLEALASSHPSPQLEAAAGAARELLYTSQDLLTLARGELQVPLQLSVVELAGVCERVCSEYQGVQLELNSRGVVLASEERLAQVVRNLLRNAVQASGDPTCVNVVVSEDEQWVRLTVSDCGVGFTPEGLLRLFERNYTSRAAEGGSGIGLSVVKGLVEAHGGTVQGANREGRGAEFVVQLPTLASALGDD